MTLAGDICPAVIRVLPGSYKDTCTQVYVKTGRLKEWRYLGGA